MRVLQAAAAAGYTTATTCVRAPARPGDDLLALPVDRVFTVRGTGTVVTGTLVSGALGVGDRVRRALGVQHVLQGSLATERQELRVEARIQSPEPSSEAPPSAGDDATGLGDFLGADTFGTALNDAGDVVGISGSGLQTTALLFRGGLVAPLPGRTSQSPFRGFVSLMLGYGTVEKV